MIKNKILLFVMYGFTVLTSLLRAGFEAFKPFQSSPFGRQS